MLRIIVEGPQGSGKSQFIHNVLIDALRRAGYGAQFFVEGETSPSMILSGKPAVRVEERQA